MFDFGDMIQGLVEEEEDSSKKEAFVFQQETIHLRGTSGSL